MRNLTKNGRRFFLGVFAGALLSITTQAQVFSGPGFTIGDGLGRDAQSCSVVPVAGITGNVNVATVALTSFNHTFIGDLEARVYPPGAAAPPSTVNSFAIFSPPDSTPCNFAGTYRLIDSAAQSFDNAAAGCGDATVVAPGDYRTSTYGGGTNPGPTTSLATTPGTLTPAQANGKWTVCVFDFAPPDGGTVGGTSIRFVSPTVPTAAAVTVGGRVTTAGGRGIRNASVTLTDASGNTRTTKTGALGSYRFPDVNAGETYIIGVKGKRYRFTEPSQVVNLTEESGSVNFVASPL